MKKIFTSLVETLYDTFEIFVIFEIFQFLKVSLEWTWGI